MAEFCGKYAAGCVNQAVSLPLLLITHNLGIIAEACDRVAVMYAGKIVEDGPARDVFADPAHPYTREPLCSTISLETTELHSIPGAPPNLIDPPAGCHFHPRCPDVMRVCSWKQPIDVVPGPGQARPVLAARAGSGDPAGRGRPGLEREEIAVVPTKPGARPSRLVSVRDLKPYYSIRGSFGDRLIGREAGR